MVSGGSQLLLAEEGVGRFSTVFRYGDGTEKRLPATTPAEDLLYVLEEPIRAQIRLRNIFEMTFDGMERATQREQFEKLCHIYPDVGKLCDPVRLPCVELGQRILRVNSIFGLRLLKLALYFQQDVHRIARCDYCWGWFVPKTKKVTRYCYRVTDGFPCKQRGSRFKRNLVEEQDGALRICNQLRDQMYARFLRWQDAAPTERDNLIPIGLRSVHRMERERTSCPDGVSGWKVDRRGIPTADRHDP